MPITATVQAFVDITVVNTGEATATLNLADLDIDFLVDEETLTPAAVVAVEEALALLRATVVTLTLTATARP